MLSWNDEIMHGFKENFRWPSRQSLRWLNSGLPPRQLREKQIHHYLCWLNVPSLLKDSLLPPHAGSTIIISFHELQASKHLTGRLCPCFGTPASLLHSTMGRLGNITEVADVLLNFVVVCCGLFLFLWLETFKQCSFKFGSWVRNQFGNHA